MCTYSEACVKELTKSRSKLDVAHQHQIYQQVIKGSSTEHENERQYRALGQETNWRRSAKSSEKPSSVARHCYKFRKVPDQLSVLRGGGRVGVIAPIEQSTFAVNSLAQALDPRLKLLITTLLYIRAAYFFMKAMAYPMRFYLRTLPPRYLHVTSDI